jgi:HSP20 family protein
MQRWRGYFSTMFRRWRSRKPPHDLVFDDELGDAFGAAIPHPFDPEYDVRTDESAIRFHLDVPGVKESALTVEVHEGTLTVAGTRPFEAGEEGEQVLLGRRYGRFSRGFKLPDDADSEGLTAKLEDGVLHIVIPRRATPGRRKVPSLAGSAPKRLGGGSSGGSQ